MPYGQTNSALARDTARLKRGDPVWAYLSLIAKRFGSKVKFVAVLLLITLVAFLSSTNASAATRTSTLVPADQARAFAYYKALRACMAINGGWYEKYSGSIGTVNKPDNISQEGAVGYKWFADGTVIRIYVGVVNETREGSTGELACGGSEGAGWISQAATLWGYTSGPQLLCDLGFTRETNLRCTDTPTGVNSDFIAPSDDVSRLDKLWTDTLGNGSVGIASITSTGGAYRLFLDTLLSPSGCKASAITSGGDYSIRVYNDATKAWETKRYVAGDRDRGTGYRPTVWDQTTMTCREIADQINGADDAAVQGYSAWIQDNPDQVDTAGPGNAACERSGDCPTATTSCNIDGIGWLLCPILTAGAALADDFYGVIADFLEFDATLLNTNPDARSESNKLIGTGTLSAWRVMQGFANIAFVIAFLIIIFSQLTGLGVSNYGVKKLLPRAIIAAILVNLSFYICQIAVDISNIAGYSLKSLFTGIADQISATGGGAAPSTTDESTNLGGIALVVLTAGGLAWANVGALIIAVVGAVVSLLTIFVLLIIRKVLIVLLIVVAPLAFVAYLLPNTQPLFDKWRKLLTTLLLLFPIIGLLYGACLLASAILLQVAGDDTLLKIVAYMALVVPLIAAIPLLKSSLDGVGKIGGAIQAFGQKARGAAEKGTQTAYDRSRLGQFKKFREGERDRRRSLIQAGVYQGRGGRLNPRNWMSGANRKANQLSGQFGTRTAAGGVKVAAGMEEENIAAAETLMEHVNLSADQRQAIALGQEVTHGGVTFRGGDIATRKAAIKRQANGKHDHVKALVDAGLSGDLGRHLARSLAASSSRPTWLGQGALEEIASGVAAANGNNGDYYIAKSIEGNAYSPDKIATGDGDELTEVLRVAKSPLVRAAAAAKLKQNAIAINGDQRLKAQVSKNVKQVADLQNL